MITAQKTRSSASRSAAWRAAEAAFAAAFRTPREKAAASTECAQGPDETPRPRPAGKRPILTLKTCLN